MKPFETIKDDLIRALLWLLMLLALIASMRHVAWLFSTIEMMSLASGWVAAVGFDFGIFLLTLIAHKYKEGTAQRRFIRVGIYANAVLSAIANVMYGVEHQVELERVRGLMWLLIPYVFALALPLMVVFFAEVLSQVKPQRETPEGNREMAVNLENNKPKAIICDLDGTLCHNPQRSAFFLHCQVRQIPINKETLLGVFSATIAEDNAYPVVSQLINFYIGQGYAIIFLTTRLLKYWR